MGIEDEIRLHLANGYGPGQVIRNFGLKKSTVYKVYGEQKLTTAFVTPASWSVDGIAFNRGPEARYLPNETATVNFSLVNRSSGDLYVLRAGIQPEWLQTELGMGQSEWLAQPGTFLLGPGERRPFRFNIKVPEGTALGEYDLRFGIEGQFMSPFSVTPSNLHALSVLPRMDRPVVFRVQYPLTHTAFVSHSTENLSLVRQLDQSPWSPG